MSNKVYSPYSTESQYQYINTHFICENCGHENEWKSTQCPNCNYEFNN